MCVRSLLFNERIEREREGRGRGGEGEGEREGEREREREREIISRNNIFRYSVESYSDCAKFRTFNIQNTNSSSAKKPQHPVTLVPIIMCISLFQFPQNPLHLSGCFCTPVCHTCAISCRIGRSRLYCKERPACLLYFTLMFAFGCASVDKRCQLSSWHSQKRFPPTTC